jgi:hypothetical protein
MRFVYKIIDINLLPKCIYFIKIFIHIIYKKKDIKLFFKYVNKLEDGLKIENAK